MSEVNSGTTADSTFKYLLISRAARSTALIYVTLSVPLYLLELSYSIVSIGIVYLFVSLSTVLVSLLIGILGDRIGFRKAMILGEIPAIFLTVALTFSTSKFVILAGIIASGAAGSAGAMRGAFSPGITAYIASNWPGERQRVSRIGTVTYVASVFSVAGSLLLYSHGFMAGIFGSLDSFRILYGIAFALVSLSTFSLALLKEVPPVKKEKPIMKSESGRYVLRVALSNMINGTGIGLAIVLLPAWFELRYGITPSQVGLVFLWSYLATAVGAYLSTRLRASSLSGILHLAVYTRSLQGIMIIFVALSPFLPVAVALYAFRSALAGFGAPNRQAINVSGIQGGDYGTATSLQGISARVSQGFSGLSGYLMDIDLPSPLIIGGIIQALSGLVYFKLMKRD